MKSLTRKMLFWLVVIGVCTNADTSVNIGANSISGTDKGNSSGVTVNINNNYSDGGFFKNTLDVMFGYSNNGQVVTDRREVINDRLEYEIDRLFIFTDLNYHYNLQTYTNRVGAIPGIGVYLLKDVKKSLSVSWGYGFYNDQYLGNFDVIRFDERFKYNFDTFNIKQKLSTSHSFNNNFDEMNNVITLNSPIKNNMSLFISDEYNYKEHIDYKTNNKIMMGIGIEF